MYMKYYRYFFFSIKLSYKKYSQNLQHIFIYSRYLNYRYL